MKNETNEETKLKAIYEYLDKAYNDRNLKLLWWAKHQYSSMIFAMDRLLPHEYTKLYKSDLTREDLTKLLKKVKQLLKEYPKIDRYLFDVEEI